MQERTAKISLPCKCARQRYYARQRPLPCKSAWRRSSRRQTRGPVETLGPPRPGNTWARTHALIHPFRPAPDQVNRAPPPSSSRAAVECRHAPPPIQSARPCSPRSRRPPPLRRGRTPPASPPQHELPDAHAFAAVRCPPPPPASARPSPTPWPPELDS